MSKFANFYLLHSLLSLSLTHARTQNLLFSPSSLFLHQASSVAAGVPTFSDLDLMITCVVAQFRTNHRNSHIFSVCLDPSSPPVFRLAFVEGLCTVLKEVSLTHTHSLASAHVFTYHIFCSNYRTKKVFITQPRRTVCTICTELLNMYVLFLCSETHELVAKEQRHAHVRP